MTYQTLFFSLFVAISFFVFVFFYINSKDYSLPKTDYNPVASSSNSQTDFERKILIELDKIKAQCKDNNCVCPNSSF